MLNKSEIQPLRQIYMLAYCVRVISSRVTELNITHASNVFTHRTRENSIFEHFSSLLLWSVVVCQIKRYVFQAGDDVMSLRIKLSWKLITGFLVALDLETHSALCCCVFQQSNEREERKHNENSSWSSSSSPANESSTSCVQCENMQHTKKKTTQHEGKITRTTCSIEQTAPTRHQKHVERLFQLFFPHFETHSRRCSAARAHIKLQNPQSEKMLIKKKEL